MRTREYGYDDYGFAKGEEKLYKERCRHRDEETYKMLHAAAWQANPDIAEEICFSLLRGLSYDRICVAYEIPYSAVDFYAYRRKALAIYKEMCIQLPQTIMV